MTNNENELEEIKKQIELEKAKKELEQLKTGNISYSDSTSSSRGNEKIEWFARQRTFIIIRLVLPIVLFIIGFVVLAIEPMVGLFIIIPVSILGFVFLIFHLIFVIKTLATTYDNEVLDREKIVWGLLGLLLLFEIANLVWSIKCKNALK